MFWSRRPRCPVDLREKVWTELRLAWLASKLGRERFPVGTEVLDSPRRFRETSSNGELQYGDVLDAICEQMRFDRSMVSYELHSSEGVCHDDGTYVIQMASSPYPRLQTAKLAHGVACAVLAERGHFEFPLCHAEQQAVAELLVTVHGLGVLEPNVDMVEPYHATSDWSPLWSRLRFGRLSAELQGYALALLYWLPGGNDVPDASVLGRDAAAAFAGGLQFLRKTGDSLVSARNWSDRILDRRLSTLEEELASGSDGSRLAAIWELNRRGGATELAAVLVEHLNHRNPLLRSEAALVMAAIGDGAELAVPALLNAVRNERESEALAHCALALGRIVSTRESTGVDRHDAVSLLLRLFDEARDRYVADTTAEALAVFGGDAAPIAPQLVKCIHKAIVDGDQLRARRLASCLRRVRHDASAFLEHRFEDRDPELLATAMEALSDTDESRLSLQQYEEQRGSVLNLRRSLG